MKQLKWLKIGMLLLLAAMLLATAACGNKENVKEEPKTNVEEPTTAGDAKSDNNASVPTGTVYPLKLTDATGTELAFEQAPQRIVTLVPSETEIVYAIGAGDAVVGVDDYSNYPEDAAAKTRIGGMEANIEAIVGLKPDLVLASSTMNAPVIAKLRELKLNVYATDPKSYDAVIEKIKQVGVIMNKSEQADEVAKHMQDVRAEVTEAIKDAPKPKVYLEFSPGYTVGKGEFLDELLTIAGGINIADQPSWYQIDPEQVIKTNPDVIIYASMIVNEGEANPILTEIESRPGWDTINARKNNKLFEVAQDPLVRVGPRLADGLLEVAKKLHPDLVK
ncbi:Vitamin B12-binding protein [Paenibacillus plantiphilus]|uniref:Vitamin B12-binding protein n=1 Tax=Paenibacillus plantiphilus TaxID=2905650 RepID=A0ABM9BYS0_9BACL|nr:ABC transporter substrate-binding protein [Paenibacillus plantiphilus]CAH1197712.1 Vitamin B12-binding protein [Paenibacillus plantiphilus]